MSAYPLHYLHFIFAEKQNTIYTLSLAVRENAILTKGLLNLARVPLPPLPELLNCEDRVEGEDKHQGDGRPG